MLPQLWRAASIEQLSELIDTKKNPEFPVLPPIRTVITAELLLEIRVLLSSTLLPAPIRPSPDPLLCPSSPPLSSPSCPAAAPAAASRRARRRLPPRDAHAAACRRRLPCAPTLLPRAAPSIRRAPCERRHRRRESLPVISRGPCVRLREPLPRISRARVRRRCRSAARPPPPLVVLKVRS